mmetsp:Transcript_12820/g.37245  ORF Transcript_12820/g.37245 Transcript_12820/m.37245 type:complete len:211 (-) Transcript_12820:1266-1898(-)
MRLQGWQTAAIAVPVLAAHAVSRNCQFVRCVRDSLHILHPVRSELQGSHVGGCGMAWWVAGLGGVLGNARGRPVHWDDGRRVWSPPDALAWVGVQRRRGMSECRCPQRVDPFHVALHRGRRNRCNDTAAVHLGHGTRPILKARVLRELLREFLDGRLHLRGCRCPVVLQVDGAVMACVCDAVRLAKRVGGRAGPAARAGESAIPRVAKRA